MNGPKMNHAQFGSWLMRWMAVEKISVGELADRMNVSRSTISTLRQGLPPGGRRVGANPDGSHSINFFAALADALNLQLSYVLERAGLAPEGDRWTNFSPVQLAALARLLGGDVADLDALLDDITRFS